MKRLISLILLLFLLPSVTLTINSCEGESIGASTIADKPITYLFVGYDDVAENTDSIILANYSFADNTISFLQIPRDTFYKDAPLHKINSIFPSERNRGADQPTAMLYLKNQISETLGIEITSHIGFSTKTFKDLVDAIGGVNLHLPKDIALKDSRGNIILELSRGNNLLFGDDALLFVRARNLYLRGDLGRVDAQKLFISAFVKKLQEDISVANIISAFISCKEGWIIDAKLGDFFKILSLNRGRLNNIKVKFATLPGNAAQDLKGNWYYSVSKSGANDVLDNLGFYRASGFDLNKKLLLETEDNFKKIYYGNFKAKIYDMSSLAEIDILTE